MYYKRRQLVILTKFNLPFLTLQMLIAAIFTILASTATLTQTAPSGGYNYGYSTPNSHYYFQSGYSPYNRPYYTINGPPLPTSHKFHHQKIAKAPEYGNIDCQVSKGGPSRDIKLDQFLTKNQHNRRKSVINLVLGIILEINVKFLKISIKQGMYYIDFLHNILLILKISSILKT